MESLELRVQHREMEPSAETAPTGFVQIEQGSARAVLLTPDEIDPRAAYPLVTVFHGAGRQDEMLAKVFGEAPERHQALFLIPRSVLPTWDLIAGGGRADLDFLEYAYDLICRRYPVDGKRQALMGYSDGASYALSVGLSNQRMFDAILCWAAGFTLVDRNAFDPEAPKPRIYLEHGTHDELFPFEKIAVPIRRNLEQAGYEVTVSVDQGGRHWPSSTFHSEALEWYFGGRMRPT